MSNLSLILLFRVIILGSEDTIQRNSAFERYAFCWFFLWPLRRISCVYYPYTSLQLRLLHFNCLKFAYPADNVSHLFLSSNSLLSIIKNLALYGHMVNVVILTMNFNCMMFRVRYHSWALKKKKLWVSIWHLTYWAPMPLMECCKLSKTPTSNCWM